MIGNILLGLAVGASMAATITSVLLHKRIEKLTAAIDTHKHETQRLEVTIGALSDVMREQHQEALDATNNIAKTAGDAVKKEVYNMAFTGIKMWH